ncbi:MAG: hypothetical protein HY812_07650 [Planctomycetes bacterium]|nr:hypothetical protein [Planctomycetota bacterium]
MSPRNRAACSVIAFATLLFPWFGLFVAFFLAPAWVAWREGSGAPLGAAAGAVLVVCRLLVSEPAQFLLPALTAASAYWCWRALRPLSAPLRLKAASVLTTLALAATAVLWAAVLAALFLVPAWLDPAPRPLDGFPLLLERAGWVLASGWTISALACATGLAAWRSARTFRLLAGHLSASSA